MAVLILIIVVVVLIAVAAVIIQVRRRRSGVIVGTNKTGSNKPGRGGGDAGVDADQ